MYQKVMSEYQANADESYVDAIRRLIDEIGLDGLAELVCVVFEDDPELSVEWAITTLIGSLNQKKNELFPERQPNPEETL